MVSDFTDEVDGYLGQTGDEVTTIGGPRLSEILNSVSLL